MKKIWFILIDGKRDGPLSYEDLKNDRRITPDTLVWKEGFKGWKQIREVPELKALFEDDSGRNQGDARETAIVGKKSGEDELVLDMGQEPPYFLWILLALIALLYVIIQLYS